MNKILLSSLLIAALGISVKSQSLPASCVTNADCGISATL